MDKLNKQLVKAGLYYLIKSNRDLFLDRLAMYLQDKQNLIDFLFDGSLPINNKVISKIEDYIKSTLPCSDYFDKILDIEIDFDYNYNQIYSVTYNVTRFYDKDNSPWTGCPTKDSTHTIEKLTEFKITISPSDLKNLNNNV